MTRRISVPCVLSLAALLAGCSLGSPHPRSHAPTTGTSNTTSTSTFTSTSTSTTTSGRFVPGTSPNYEFMSPSRNISCEITYGQGAPTETAYCETNTPIESVTMSPDGSYRICSGPQCGSNPGVGTPTLAYGDSTGLGPFRCTSTTGGMVCTAEGGKGFEISTSGITPVAGG